ncbi:MAG: FkbM family methyltransferase [bacterium]|nr:FkbM family methyltransferase [bacterium]
MGATATMSGVRGAVEGLLLFGARVFQRLARFFEPEQARRVRPWLAVDGDRTLRVDYDLTPDSVVFDLGGYEGQWANEIVGRYGCRVFVFEPVPAFAEGIERRFAGNVLVRVLRVGLADRDAQANIVLDADGSSMHRDGGARRVSIELRRAADVVRELDVRRIDLMKINIEGAEYDLLEHLIGCGLIGSIRDIQIQFHDFVADAVARRDAIRRELAKTHETTYCYPFVWENWRRKDAT